MHPAEGRKGNNPGRTQLLEVVVENRLHLMEEMMRKAGGMTLQTIEVSFSFDK